MPKQLWRFAQTGVSVCANRRVGLRKQVPAGLHEQASRFEQNVLVGFQLMAFVCEIGFVGLCKWDCRFAQMGS